MLMYCKQQVLRKTMLVQHCTNQRSCFRTKAGSQHRCEHFLLHCLQASGEAASQQLSRPLEPESMHAQLRSMRLSEDPTCPPSESPSRKRISQAACAYSSEEAAAAMDPRCGSTCGRRLQPKKRTVRVCRFIGHTQRLRTAARCKCSIA